MYMLLMTPFLLLHLQMLTLLLVAVIATSVSVSGFTGCLHNQSTRSSSTSSTSTAIYGIFDSMKKSMESGYAGGEDSPYSKIQEKDKQKELAAKKRSDERRKRGYKELKDVTEKTFVKTKYGNKGDKDEKIAKKAEEPPKEEKKRRS